MDPFPSSGRVLPPNSSGIKVVIVGCDIAGLGCAIECARKGHKVIVLEKYDSKVKSLDEVVTLTPNAARFIERWGLHDSLHSIRIRPNFLHPHNHLGESTPPDRYGTPQNKIHKLLRAHALSLGAEIRTGHNVIAYRQNELIRKAGVILDNGEGVAGHLVVSVGDGRTDMPGEEKKRISSRYAIHRPLFDAGDPSDRVTTDVQCSLGGKAASCSTHTHRDEADHKDDAVGVDGRRAHYAAVSLSSKAPSASIMSWAYSDPLPTRIKGRVLIIGDAFRFAPSNPHDPSQAIEDGVVLAVTLQLAGVHNVPLAVKAWERIRHQQLINQSTRGKRRGHATSGYGADDTTSTHGGDGSEGGLFAPNAEKDAYDFDAEKDAYECYPEVMLRLLEEWESGGRGEPVNWL